MSGGIRLDEDDRRAIVTLSRPGSRNAIDAGTASELHEVCSRLESEHKVLIVTGDGGVFCSGADLKEIQGRGVDYALAGIHSSIFRRIRELPMPTIAAVDGPAVGGGAELAYACDFRIATPRAWFGQPEAGIGLLATAGATWRLRELVGEPLANEMLLAGRTLGAQEALAAGLANELVDPGRLMDAAESLVDRVLKAPPMALRLAKLAMRMPREGHPWFDDVAQAALLGTEDAARRVAAFLDRPRGGPAQP